MFFNPVFIHPSGFYFPSAFRTSNLTIEINYGHAFIAIHVRIQMQTRVIIVEEVLI